MTTTEAKRLFEINPLISTDEEREKETASAMRGALEVTKS